MRFSTCVLFTITVTSHSSFTNGFKPALLQRRLSWYDINHYSPLSSIPSSPCSIRAMPWRLYSSNPGEDDTSDDFDFDPLRSPHDYPNGIDSKKKTTKSNNIDDDDWTPLQIKNVKDDFRGSSKQDYRTQKSYFTTDWASSPSIPSPSNEAGKDDEDTNSADDFDPLLSPHVYPNGTSSKPVPTKASFNSTSRQKIGVLLIDHGSKRPSSNDHLVKVASLYQSRAPPNIIVRAAHMEIVPPFIKDGIEALWKEDGVDRIVCHPYFLSPGRHVKEDIPELIYGAVVELNGDSVVEGAVWDGMERLWLGVEGDEERTKRVDVVMTEPVGSNIERMVDIVGDMVGDMVGADALEQVGSSGDVPLGGFFGNIKKLMDEQL